MASSGYSGTPLVKKLGIKPGFRLRFVNPPPGYPATLGPLPEGVTEVEDADRVDFIQFFSISRAELETRFAGLRDAIADDGMLWISWPKRASKVETDLHQKVVREVGLANGLVDVKVCAVDETWTGLKFVRRLKDRRRA